MIPKHSLFGVGGVVLVVEGDVFGRETEGDLAGRLVGVLWVETGAVRGETVDICKIYARFVIGKVKDRKAALYGNDLG